MPHKHKKTKLPVLDGRSWLGIGSYYGTQFLVALRESRKHPGYYHYAVICMADDGDYIESKRPIQPNEDFPLDTLLDELLKPHGLRGEDLRWRVAKDVSHFFQGGE